jgi:bifunctional non-homologous end joining protein LigD
MTCPYKPMLAKKAEAGDIPRGDYAYELKWDGIRAIVKVSETGHTQIWSRSGRDITQQFPELWDVWQEVDALEAGVYDCEIVVFDQDGRPSFPLATSRLHLGDDVGRKRGSKLNPATLMVFDLLESEGDDWTDELWHHRRAALEELVDSCDRVKISPVYLDGDEAMAFATEHNLEGIMAKKKFDRYACGKRRSSWAKVKRQLIMDVRVIGYTEGLGKRDGYFGALLLEDMDGNDCGRVGTGFTDAELSRYRQMLDQVGVSSWTTRGKERLCFLKRPLDAEVQAMYRTDDGSLREPVFREFKAD